MIEWHDSYSTGIEELDKQHRSLFQFSNDLEVIVKEGGVTDEILSEALAFLKQYALQHFGREESCMYKLSCPVAFTNKEAHHQFIEGYQAFEVRIKSGGARDPFVKELHFFLERWLVDHICKIDVQLKTCVKV